MYTMQPVVRVYNRLYNQENVGIHDAAGCTTGWTNYVNELSQMAQPSGPAVARASSLSLMKKKLNHHTLATCNMTQSASVGHSPAVAAAAEVRRRPIGNGPP